MNTTTLIIVSSVVVIVLLWAIVGLRHLQHLRRVVLGQWELIDEKLRKRADLVPNLVETVRSYVPIEEAVLERVINDRLKAAKEYGLSGKKIEVEYALSMRINELVGFGKNSGELARDTNFLELKKEFDDIEGEIEVRTNEYNKLVRKYNRNIEMVLLWPLARIFGFGKLNIFEIER